MPCCCICKSPLALLAVVGIGLGVAFAATAGPDDKKAEQPKPAPVAPKPEPGKTEPAKPADQKNATPKPADAKVDRYVLGFKMNRIDGTSEDLSAYKGKVIMIVNVASQCGYTKQYAGLEKLFEKRKDQGFVILGFPANDFGQQEPGTNKDIKEFCTSKFGVTFPMFEKIIVKGPDAAPLYKKLAAQPAPIGGEPKWNFTKFLVDRNGNVVARYESKTTPEDADLAKKIDELLSAKAEGAEPSKQ